ncbi:hypothetical protein KFL_006940020 [Klebsormidium nitens]|uniref:Rab3 GTPase-activating protein catalytic subunit n=1 Tax=Klebsormidium nitens TaxID=105231 RepID=A0A1Y1IJI1_KLENI|nr:hypothetical protein KFL_006940020 [Klebsormidium nitens]|eukprot:GAQ90863.1 hypothetical protein KFL_006940020 [Klebsormidium nitens]
MGISEDEGEGFEDFTLASPWEKLLDGFEKAVRAWQAADGGVQAGASTPHLVHLEYAGQKLFLRRHVIAPQASGGGTAPDPWGAEHPLQLQFGVTDFLICGPAEGKIGSALASMLLSTAAVGLANAGSSLPAFIPLPNLETAGHRGIAVRTSVGLVQYLDTERTVHKAPAPHPELPALVDSLRGRMRLLGTAPDPVALHISMRQTFETPGLALGDPSGRSEAAGQAGGDGEDGFWDDDTPWAAWRNLDDPVRGFRVSASWPFLSAAGPKDVRAIEVKPAGSAAEWRLEPVFDTTHSGAVTAEGEASGFASSLRALSIAYLCTIGTKFMDDFAHSNLTERNEMWALRRAFDVPGSLFQIPPPTAIIRSVQKLFDEDSPLPEAPPAAGRPLHLPCKAAPPGSLFARFSMQALRSPRIQAVAALWTQLVQEVRWFWEEAEPLPHVAADGPPDLACCLVHQKLQMLAACIRKRAADPDFRRKSRRTSEQRTSPADDVSDRDTPDESDSHGREAAEGPSRGGGDDWNSAPGWEDADFEEERASDATDADVTADARKQSADQPETDTLAASVFDCFRTQEEAASEASADTQYDSCSDTEVFESGGGYSPTEPSTLSAGGRPSWAHSPGGASEVVRKRGKEKDWRVRGNFGGGEKGPGQRGRDEEDMDGREGSLGPVKNLWLLKVKRRIHEPITQEPPYMTEDMLREQETALAALSSFDQGKDALARLHSRMLSSDMSAFKAANPGALLEDFVRWHSPRDWLPEDSETRTGTGTGTGTSSSEGVPGWPPQGKVSRRMQADSFWGELWERAEALPVTDQRPLFDHTREAEKVLHYLDTIEPQDLLPQMLATAFYSALDLLAAARGASVPTVSELRKALASEMSGALDLGLLQQQTKDESTGIQSSLEALCNRFEELEALIVRAASLSHKLPGRPQLVSELLSAVQLSNRGDPPSSLKVESLPAAQETSPGVVIDLATHDDRNRAALIAGIPELFSDRRAGSGHPGKEASERGGVVSIGRRPATVEYVLVQGLHGCKDSGETRLEPSVVLTDRMYVRSTPSTLLMTTAFWKPPWPGS